MSMRDDGFLHRPREAIQCLLIGICFVWQWFVGLLGLVLFLILILIRGLRYPAWQIFLIGILLAIFSVLLLELQVEFTPSFFEIIRLGFINHLIFWKIFFYQGLKAALIVVYQQSFYYLLGFPLLLAGLLGMIELIPNSTHEWELRAIQGGRELSSHSHWKSQFQHWYKRFTKQKKQPIDGILLGISTTHQAVIIPDQAVNQMVLVLGTTGGGKTVTLRRFYQRALQQAYPLIIIDGKPTEENVAWLQKRSQHYQRSFYGFNCAEYHHYDPLAHGGYTELKDKLISLKDHWENDYYRYTGCRDQEICHLKWDWEIKVPEGSVFLIPEWQVKNREERLVVLNKIANRVIEEVRGIHPEYVFTFKGNPITRMLNSAWKKARLRVGMPQVRVHDLKHTFGRRLRAAEVSFEDRQDLLGHKSGRITTHYSAAELANLIRAANKACDEVNQLVVLKRNASVAPAKVPQGNLRVI